MQFVKVNEIATLLKVTVRAVQKWLKLGKLTGYLLGGIWRVKQSDLDLFLSTRKNNRSL